MYDIAIIGLGPGGATLARLLGRSFRVAAIDKKGPVADGFRKPCGGLLAADAQKALSRFNLTLPKDVLVDPQIFAVKTVDTQQNLLRHYQRFYINLDRHKFDRWLTSLIPPRVEVLEQATCTDIQKKEDGYEITYRSQGISRQISSRWIIGADGSNSIVRNRLFAHRKIQRYLSLQQWFPEQSVSPFYSCVFDREITDSYCWSISKDGFFILGGAFPARDSKQRFERLKIKLREQGFVFGEPLKTEACLVSRPRRWRDFCTGEDGVFLLGEAAGFISPSSLEGISYALNSAYQLAAIINSRCKNPQRAYRRKTFPMRVKL
ncbi:MAG: FAD-binding protein, partial [Peptococcaceae bacterium]|nr:FAD-binding protein [Peptococcaceae bacterium]